MKMVRNEKTRAELAEHPYIVTVLRAGVTDDGRVWTPRSVG